MKKLLIRQPAGLGDIFMCLKIAKVYQDKGYDIIWPVYDDYIYINDYLQTDFKFIPQSSNFQGKELFVAKSREVIDSADFMYLPLQDASWVVGEPVMDAKFRISNVDIKDYLDYFNFTRNTKRENDLMYNKLDLMDISSYRLLNKNYASLPDTRVFDRNFIQTPRNLFNVEMIIDKYSHIFDWCKTIEYAKEFHTVGTSITFIVEKLNLRGEQIFMYRRPEAVPENFSIEKSLFKKPWRFVQ